MEKKLQDNARKLEEDTVSGKIKKVKQLKTTTVL